MSHHTTPTRIKSNINNNNNNNNKCYQNVPHISLTTKTNYEQLLQTLQARINILYEQQSNLVEKQDKMLSQIKYARPSDIKIHNMSNSSSCSSNGDGEDVSFDVLKKIVQIAVSYKGYSSSNNNNVQNSGNKKNDQQFRQINNQIQSQIQLKMNYIQQLDKDITIAQHKQQSTIIQLQKSQDHLKSILKSKGPLQQAQKYEKQKKTRTGQIRYIRQNLQSLKGHKILRIKEVVECLKKLEKYRCEYVERIQSGFGAPGCEIEKIGAVLSNFVGNLNLLLRQKNSFRNNTDNQNNGNNPFFPTFGSRKNSQQQIFGHQQNSNSNKRRDARINSISNTPKNSFINNQTPKPFNLTQKRQSQQKDTKNKNMNRLQTKRIQNLPHQTVLTQPVNRRQTLDSIYNNHNQNTNNSNNQNIRSIQQIISQVHSYIIPQYQQILKKLQILQQQQSKYFKNKNERILQQCRIKAMQKLYLVGVLGYQPNQQENDGQEQEYDHVKYENIINFAIKKCHEYQVSASSKYKQKIGIIQKIQNIRQSQSVLKQKIDNLTSQNQTKQNIFTQIQKMIKNSNLMPRKASKNIKQYITTLQQQRIKQKLLQKQQEQYADIGDLYNYKQTAQKIQAIKRTIEQLQRKYKNEEQIQARYKYNSTGGVGNNFNYNNNNNYGEDTQNVWKAIKNIVKKYGIDVDVDMIASKTSNGIDAINKFQRRLLSI